MGEMNGYGYGAGLGFLQTLGVIQTARTTLHSFLPYDTCRATETVTDRSARDGRAHRARELGPWHRLAHCLPAIGDIGDSGPGPWGLLDIYVVLACEEVCRYAFGEC